MFREIWPWPLQRHFFVSEYGFILTDYNYISNICIISYSLSNIQLKSTKYLYVWLFKKNNNGPNFSRYLCPQTVGSIMIAESMYTRLKETINVTIYEENPRKSSLSKKINFDLEWRSFSFSSYDLLFYEISLEQSFLSFQLTVPLLWGLVWRTVLQFIHDPSQK